MAERLLSMLTSVMARLQVYVGAMGWGNGATFGGLRMCDFDNIIFLLFSLAYDYLLFSLGVFARLADWRLRLSPFFFVLVRIDVEAHSAAKWQLSY